MKWYNKVFGYIFALQAVVCSVVCVFAVGCTSKIETERTQSDIEYYAEELYSGDPERQIEAIREIAQSDEDSDVPREKAQVYGSDGSANPLIKRLADNIVKLSDISPMDGQKIKSSDDEKYKGLHDRNTTDELRKQIPETKGLNLDFNEGFEKVMHISSIENDSSRREKIGEYLDDMKEQDPYPKQVNPYKNEKILAAKVAADYVTMNAEAFMAIEYAMGCAESGDTSKAILHLSELKKSLILEQATVESIDQAIDSIRTGKVKLKKVKR